MWHDPDPNIFAEHRGGEDARRAAQRSDRGVWPLDVAQHEAVLEAVLAIARD
jgi:hypothetical protein